MLGKIGFSSRNDGTHRKNQHDSQYDHDKSPELGGAHPRHKTSAIVVADIFDQEAEDPVSDQINGHIVSKLLFEEQESADPEQNKQKDRFKQLGGIDLLGHTDKLNAENRVGGLAVAATRKKASDPAEGVGDQNTAGQNADNVDQTGLILFAENKVDDQKAYRAPDQTADKRQTAVELKSLRGIFDIIVNALKQRRRQKPDDDRHDGVKGNKIGKAAFDVIAFAERPQHDKTNRDADPDHQPVQVDKSENFIGIHRFSFSSGSFRFNYIIRNIKKKQAVAFGEIVSSFFRIFF